MSIEVLSPARERALGWIVLFTVIASLLAFCALAGCAGPASHAASLEVSRIWTEINADGAITPEEQARYLAAVEAMAKAAKEDVSSFNWGEVATAALGAISTTLVGVRLWRGPSTKGQP